MGNPETKRVLKAGTAHSLQYEVAYNFEDLESRCQQYVEQVRQQTRSMIVEAQAEAESLKKSSHSEGYEVGYQAGISKAEQEIQTRIDAEVRKQVEAKTRTSIPVIQSVADTLAAQGRNLAGDRCPAAKPVGWTMYGQPSLSQAHHLAPNGPAYDNRTRCGSGSPFGLRRLPPPPLLSEHGPRKWFA